MSTGCTCCFSLMFYETYWCVAEYRIIRIIRVYVFTINLIKHGSIINNFMHSTFPNHEVFAVITFSYQRVALSIYLPLPCQGRQYHGSIQSWDISENRPNIEVHRINKGHYCELFISYFHGLEQG